MDIAVEGLRLLGNFVEKRCLNRGRGYNALKQAAGNEIPDAESQYNIIINPRFSDGTTGWFGEGCSLSVGSIDDDDGSSCYCVAHGRSWKGHGLAQEIGKRLDAGGSYRVEAWVGIRSSSQAAEQEQALVHATVKVARDGGGEESVLISRFLELPFQSLSPLH